MWNVASLVQRRLKVHCGIAIAASLTLLLSHSVVAGALDIPTDLRLQFTGTNQLTATWIDNASAETGYEVQRRTGDLGTWTQVQLTAANIASWVDGTVPANNYVFYRVRTRNGTQSSNWSNIAVANNPGDSDADGIPDSVEVAAGLNPTDWLDGSADLDGDGIPNAWEYARGSDLNDNTSYFAADVTVDPNVVTETASVKRTITAAINALTATPVYKTVLVKSGVYTERVVLPAGKKIALLAEAVGAPPEIRGHGTNGSQLSTVEILGEAVIDGFRITRRDPLLNGFGVLMSTNSRDHVRVVNCVIFGNSFATGVAGGTGIDQRDGRLGVVHTTVYGNARNGAFGGAAGLYCNPAGNVYPQAQVINSIFWNAPSGSVQEISYLGQATFRDCIIRNGSLWGGLTSDPLLNPRGYLISGSPAIGTGGVGHGAPFDIDGEVRDGTPDIGADEHVDLDVDEVPDRFEAGGDLLPGGDADSDGLANLDEYELYGTDPTISDSDGDGMNDGDEIAAGANPFNPDSDEDGMTDGFEHLHGLIPTDAWDRLGDADGDRVPNYWEFKRGTSASDANSRPTTDWIVSPSQAGTGIYKATINQAIEAVNATSGHYAIIEVRPGTYTEGLDVSNGRKILLLGDQQAQPVEIRAPAASHGVWISGEAVIDGFRITRVADYHGNGHLYSGVYVNVNLPNLLLTHSKVVNCLIHGQKVSLSGAGVRVLSGRLLVAHTSIFDNSSSTEGNGVTLDGSSRMKMVNSIVWNPLGVAANQIQKAPSASLLLMNSIVYGGEYGGANADPQLNPRGNPASTSPAVNAGAAFDVATKDFQGEARAGSPDLGADEFIDSDSDGLPDWVEAAGAVAPGIDTDGDGLSNLDEYALYGSLAHVSDTDGDGLNDGLEIGVGADPHVPDTDYDLMPDGFEVTHGLDPLNLRDALDDKDGDRIPNVYEWYHSTNPSLGSSLPAVHLTVDSSATETANVKKTISSAINASAGYPYRIVLVKSGTYDENVALAYSPVLLLGELGNTPPTVARKVGEIGINFSTKHHVVDGLAIKPALGGTGERGIYVNLRAPNDQVRIVNCSISGHYYTDGAGIYVVFGEIAVEHCTIFNNVCTQSNNNGSAGIYLAANTRLRLLKSIVWNPRQTSGVNQVVQTTPGTLQVSNSIILGGEHGASSIDPLIEPFSGRLRAASTAIDSSGAASASLVAKDLQGEPRDSMPDIGADEFIDTDIDGLPDSWEQKFYGNLLQTGAGDTDNDGLKNLEELLAGLDPTQGDTDGDGISDLREALATAHLAHTTIQNLADDDGDGLTNAQESIVGTDSAVADSNGDGVRDGASWVLGIHPMAADSDGDGVSNMDELMNGTCVLLADSDGDGVADGLDAFPLDPSSSTLPSTPGDMTAPTITLTKPPGAVLVP